MNDRSRVVRYSPPWRVTNWWWYRFIWRACDEFLCPSWWIQLPVVGALTVFWKGHNHRATPSVADTRGLFEGGPDSVEWLRQQREGR